MEKSKDTFYGRYARLVILIARFFSKKYEYPDAGAEGPVVYVCRHLDMHGPIEAIVNLPFPVHALTLHVFMDNKACEEHFSTYTFSTRVGKKAGFWRKLGAKVAGNAIAPLMRSLQAVPVYREGTESIKTMRQGVKYLEKGESLIVWPDVEYTGDYGEDFDIYSGFLFMGEIYRKRTGKELPFIPLVLDEERGTIIRREAVFCNDFKQEEERAAQLIKQGIDKRNVGESVNSVQVNL